MSQRHHVVLMNIGSPESPTKKAVGQYLRRFLMDPDIIQIPKVIRWILVNLIIVPFRAERSARNYKKVWTSEGSPLIALSKKFADQLQTVMNQNHPEKIKVHLAMSFSEPEISTALHIIQQLSDSKILLCPMYPQFAQATTGGSIRQFEAAVKKLKLKNLEVKKLPDFYNHPAYIKALARPWVHDLRCRFTSEQLADTHFLFSFHGLPESQLKKDSQCLLSDSCCQLQSSCDRRCYRAQCFATAKLLAAELQLHSENQWSIGFQSRLGKAEWIKPYTDQVAVRLAGQGVKNLVVFSPAFVVDCLETLEEIHMELKNEFLEAGGQSFTPVPCPNSDPEWVRDFAKIVENNL